MVFEAREEQLLEEKRQEEIMEALKAEQRLMDHLESIRTLTETCDRTGTLQLKTINLTDITSAIFDTNDENPIVSPEHTVERKKSSGSTFYRADVKTSEHPQKVASKVEADVTKENSDNTESLCKLRQAPNAITSSPQNNNNLSLNRLSVEFSLDSLDRTLQTEIDKLSRWSRDCEGMTTFRDNIHVSSQAVPPQNVTCSSATYVKKPATDTTPTMDTAVTPTSDFRPPFERDISYVSTYSLDTLEKDEDEISELSQIRSDHSNHSMRDHSLKLSQAMSLGEVITPGDINRSFSPGEMVLADDVKPPASPDPEAIETATTAIPTPTGPPLTLETRGVSLCPLEQGEQQDSGIEMQKNDSLDSRERRSSGSSFDIVRNSESGSSSVDSRSLRHTTSCTPAAVPSKAVQQPDEMRSCSGGSMQSFDDPSVSPEYGSPSPDLLSNISKGSLERLEHPSALPRATSAASTMSDTVLTTLDRPRAKSFAGTPIKQAWLQVCCYEKDIQTGKFLIDKPMVQIDGQMLHPDAVRDADLYRISLTGLINEERRSKLEKVLPEIGQGILISRDRASGNVTLTKRSRRDVWLLNDSFLEIKDDEKCKGKHMKLEHGTPYTIFDKQVFVDGVRNGTIDVTKVPTIGQVAIAFLKVNSNCTKGLPCWVKLQCLEAMNLFKKILVGSRPEDREWLRRISPEPVSPRRSSMARLSFGSKSSSRSSLKDCKNSVASTESNTPILRKSKSKPQLFRSSKKSANHNVSTECGKVNRDSAYLEPIAHNYDSIYDLNIVDPDEVPLTPRADIFKSRRLSPSPDILIKKNLTTADVSAPLSRKTALPNT